jgi:hypothetical protein
MARLSNDLSDTLQGAGGVGGLLARTEKGKLWPCPGLVDGARLIVSVLDLRQPC